MSTENQTVEMILGVPQIFNEILSSILNDKGFNTTPDNADNTLSSLYSVGYQYTNNMKFSFEHQAEMKKTVEEIKTSYIKLHDIEESRLEKERLDHLADIKKSQETLDSMIIDVKKLGETFSKDIGVTGGVILKYPQMHRLEKTALESMMELSRFYKNIK